MDEPLSSLDAKLRGDLRLELKRIQQDLGATILYVTHDQIEAMTMANRIGVINEGKPHPDRHAARNLRGSVESSMSPSASGQPQINLLPAGVLANGGSRPARKTVGARTEHLSIRKAAKDANGTVEWSSIWATRTIFTCKVGSHRSPRSRRPIGVSNPATG